MLGNLHKKKIQKLSKIAKLNTTNILYTELLAYVN